MDAVCRNRALAEQSLRESAIRLPRHMTEPQVSNNPQNMQQFDPMRATRILSVVPLLREVAQQIVTELFFRPVLGAGLDMADVVIEMFNSKDEQYS